MSDSSLVKKAKENVLKERFTMLRFIYKIEKERYESEKRKKERRIN